MLVSRAEMTSLEKDIFARGLDAAVLMEAAGRAMAEELDARWLSGRRVVVFVGKGHNGGDALVAARHLHERYRADVGIRLAHPPAKLAPLTAAMLARLSSEVSRSMVGDDFPALGGDFPGRAPAWVLDGLLGLNAAGPLRPAERAACREINALRQRGARVAALDLPSGVDADTGAIAEDAVLAGLTLAVGFAKRGLVADGATRHVGRLAVVRLPEFAAAASRLGLDADDLARGTVTDAAALAHLLPPREFDAHKGQFGRVGIFAGSPGFSGAAILCARGALRGGAGLVSLFARRDAWPVIAAAAPAEAMVRPIGDPREILDEKLDVLALGPGLGHKNAAAVLALVEKFPGPAVVDADALNLVAGSKKGAALLGRCAGPRLVTPHPGEMLRLFPGAKALPRAETARRFADGHPGTVLLLKGARTVVAEADRSLAYNSTGDPGMATGGMGDALTGVLAALLGQKLAPYDAARLGAWLCGRAAERARRGRLAAQQSEQSLLPSDLFMQLGGAWEELRAAG